MKLKIILLFQMVAMTVVGLTGATAHAQNDRDEGERDLTRGGWIARWKRLNRAEKALVVVDPLTAYTVARIAIHARNRAAALYPHSIESGPGDAFRHAYWNALMVKHVGWWAAKAWADAHEYGPSPTTLKKRMLRKMDFFNNKAGRDCTSSFDLWVTNEQLEDRVLTLLKSGDLRVIETERSHGSPIEPALTPSTDNQRPY